MFHSFSLPQASTIWVWFTLSSRPHHSFPMFHVIENLVGWLSWWRGCFLPYRSAFWIQSAKSMANLLPMVIYKRWKFRKKRLGISQYSDCQMSRLQAHNLAWIPYSRNCFIISTEPQICLKIQEDVIGCTVEVKIVLGSITQELFQSFYNQESLVMFAH